MLREVRRKDTIADKDRVVELAVLFPSGVAAMRAGVDTRRTFARCPFPSVRELWRQRRRVSAAGSRHTGPKAATSNSACAAIAARTMRAGSVSQLRPSPRVRPRVASIIRRKYRKVK